MIMSCMAVSVIIPTFPLVVVTMRMMLVIVVFLVMFVFLNMTVFHMMLMLHFMEIYFRLLNSRQSCLYYVCTICNILCLMYEILGMVKDQRIVSLKWEMSRI